MSWALPLLLSAAAAAPVAPPPRTHRVPEAFEGRLTETWVPRDGWSEPYPVYAFLRAGAGSAVISVERYAEGNALYPTPKAFLAASARGGNAPARRSGWAHVRGQRLPMFEREYKEAPGGAAPNAPAALVARRERYLVVPARKHFLVLRLKADPVAFDPAAAEFAEFAAGFRVLSR